MLRTEFLVEEKTIIYTQGEIHVLIFQKLASFVIGLKVSCSNITVKGSYWLDFMTWAVMDRETMMKSHLLICLGSRYVTKLSCEASRHIENHRFWVFIKFN